MRALTGRLLFVGLLEVVQGLLEVPQVVIGHAGAVQGLEVLPLLPEHLETILLHSLVVDQLHLQQAGCVEERGGEEQGMGSAHVTTRSTVWVAVRWMV